jgi:hypothetical protein
MVAVVAMDHPAAQVAKAIIALVGESGRYLAWAVDVMAAAKAAVVVEAVAKEIAAKEIAAKVRRAEVTPIDLDQVAMAHHTHAWVHRTLAWARCLLPAARFTMAE